MAKNKTENACPSRLGRVGGGALIEGVMMRAGEDVAVTCRKENGELTLTREKHTPLRKKYKILNLPILRGVINFVESMVLSMHTMNISAEAYGGEIEESRFEKWMKKKLGINLFDIVTAIAMVLGVALAIALFLYLPSKCVDLLEWACSHSFDGWQEGLIEGGMKVLIFILYIWLVSLIPDIKRTFMYHGAEHKSIACYEAGEELTPANARKHTRFHPRCGTSFMFVMILLGVALGIALRYILPSQIVDAKWLYTLIRLLLLPFVVGIGFEFIMLAGKHQNIITKILSAPGIWMQRITTREPDDGMLEVAITSLKAALPEEFPDFDPTVYEEKKGEEPSAEETAAEPSTEGEA
ncbi:MAG: DUF1385 domain-containing protein [Clostridia bacterium]|nr:DUF1385 domain-containing protein [Clostridia bacterium]